MQLIFSSFFKLFFRAAKERFTAPFLWKIFLFFRIYLVSRYNVCYIM